MIKQRIIEFKDCNGNSYYRCQSKDWFFWWYYRHPPPFPFPCVSGAIREFDSTVNANNFLLGARCDVRQKVGVIKQKTR